jgi:hypothetical protein
MCTNVERVPRGVADALAMAGAAMDYLNGSGGAAVDVTALGDVLRAMSGISGKLAVARAAFLARFDAGRGYDADGYGSSASWLAAKGKTTRKAASAQVRQMRQLREHPEMASAVAGGALSEAWAGEMADWTRRLPADWRGDVDRILLDAAAAGAGLEDLAIIARAAYEKWRQQDAGPDGDDQDESGFDERYLKVGTTIDNVGRVNGNLTPECAAALQAVLDALGKKAGPEDDRTEGMRYHDALQLACELLIRAKMVPDRAGAGTRVDAVISLAELLQLPGASELQEAWLAALTGEHGYLAGKDAEVAACDAIVSPVVTGHPDLGVVDAMINLVLAHLGPDHADGNLAAPGNDSPRARSRPLSPEAWRALRYAIARLAVDLVSGSDGIASVLRRSLLSEPYTGKSVILDVGFSSGIPGHIRRAVRLRAKGRCEWPGCQCRAACCDIHHLVHQADGGETSVSGCALLCNFHHDICVHRRGWRLVLHPDATAYGPGGQVVRSHEALAGHGPP